jgi:hypothetical protein
MESTKSKNQTSTQLDLIGHAKQWTGTQIKCGSVDQMEKDRGLKVRMKVTYIGTEGMVNGGWMDHQGVVCILWNQTIDCLHKQYCLVITLPVCMWNDNFLDYWPHMCVWFNPCDTPWAQTYIPIIQRYSGAEIWCRFKTNVVEANFTPF